MGESNGFMAISREVPLTRGAMNLLQHTEHHPIPMDYECHNALHKLCGGSILLPLIVIRLLWVNLIMDTLGTMALAITHPTFILLDVPFMG